MYIVPQHHGKSERTHEISLRAFQALIGLQVTKGRRKPEKMLSPRQFERECENTTDMFQQRYHKYRQTNELEHHGIFVHHYSVLTYFVYIQAYLTFICYVCILYTFECTCMVRTLSDIIIAQKVFWKVACVTMGWMGDKSHSYWSQIISVCMLSRA